MTGILESLVRTPMCDALGWALYHSLWQGTVLALLLAAMLEFTKSSRTRYTAACLALITALAEFVATFVRQLPPSQASAGDAIPAMPLAPVNIHGLARDSASTFPRDVLPWLAPLWIAGVLLFQLRTVFGYMAAQRLRKHGVCSAPAHWQQRLGQLALRLCVQQSVALLETCFANTPAVIGYLRPVILVPAGMLTSMPSNQVEAILLHELAHIRRGDYMVNLLQTIAEGLFYYHPAIWWISKVIRAEREHCCDDIAAAGTGGAHEYAAALAALEQTRWVSENMGTAAMTATGGTGLVKRIHRLLYPQQPVRLRLAAAPITLIAIGLLAAWQSNATPPQDTQAAPYMNWLKEDVAYIITPAESQAFLALNSNRDREEFIKKFWLVRDPTPNTSQNEFKEEHYRRIAYTNERFSVGGTAGWETDRGRMYIIYGPSDEKETHPAGRDGGPPEETWLYRHIDGVGDGVIMTFIDANKNGDYRMTMDPYK